MKQRDWVRARTIAEGYKKNVRWGLGTFNNKVADESFIYSNHGHGFVDPLTGILLWIGVAVLGIRVIRRRADEGVLLALSGFLILWLSFAFIVNKAPNYTRLLVTLPFVAYLVTEAVRWLAGRWRSVRGVPALLTVTALVALASWNLTIAWDFIQTGRRDGETIGSRDGTSSPRRRRRQEVLPRDLGERRMGLLLLRELDVTVFPDTALRGQRRRWIDCRPRASGQVRGEPPFALLMRRTSG